MRLRPLTDAERSEKPFFMPTSTARPELPPPGHPIHDILRMAGVLPPEPDKPNAILERKGIGPTSSDDSPLGMLHKEIVKFFAQGPQQASNRFWALSNTILCHKTIISKDSYPSQLMEPVVSMQVPWNSCKLAATLVLVLAAPRDTNATYEALKFPSQSLGGLPNMDIINNTPSADLAAGFAKAKKAAIDGKVGKVTVLCANLVDVEMMERGENRSRDMAYTSFAHSFVLGISRAGWRIYQSWGEHGYRLEQWLGNGGAIIRDWNDAKRFLKTFSRLATSQVHLQRLLRTAQTLRTDANRICRANGQKRSTKRTKSASMSIYSKCVGSAVHKSPSCLCIDPGFDFLRLKTSKLQTSRNSLGNEEVGKQRQSG